MLLAMLEHAVAEGFVRVEHLDLIVVSNDPEALASDALVGVVHHHAAWHHCASRMLRQHAKQPTRDAYVASDFAAPGALLFAALTH